MDIPTEGASLLLLSGRAAIVAAGTKPPPCPSILSRYCCERQNIFPGRFSVLGILNRPLISFLSDSKVVQTFAPSWIRVSNLYNSYVLYCHLIITYPSWRALSDTHCYKTPASPCPSSTIGAYYLGVSLRKIRTSSKFWELFQQRLLLHDAGNEHIGRKRRK